MAPLASHGCPLPADSCLLPSDKSLCSSGCRRRTRASPCAAKGRLRRPRPPQAQSRRRRQTWASAAPKPPPRSAPPAPGPVAPPRRIRPGRHRQVLPLDTGCHRVLRWQESGPVRRTLGTGPPPQKRREPALRPPRAGRPTRRSAPRHSPADSPSLCQSVLGRMQLPSWVARGWEPLGRLGRVWPAPRLRRRRRWQRW